MEDYEKLKALFKSGRYQCDLQFYKKLYELGNELNLYEYLDQINKNKQIVEKTAQLTKKHLRTLQDEDNQQRALQIIIQLNKQIAKIDTQFTKNMFQHMEKLEGKSYEQRLVKYVKSQSYKKMYLEILDRIINSVHDPVLRFSDMLTIGLFMSKNNDKVANFVQIYSNVLQNGVNELRKHRQNLDFIKNNPEINEEPKVKSYIAGAPILLSTLLKFNEIYKLLSGDNKFGLKLNALKKDILQNNKSQTHSKPIKQFKQFLLNGAAVPNICSLCLCESQDHPECRNTIKILYQKQSS